MQKTLSSFLGLSMLVSSFAFALVMPAFATSNTADNDNWDTSGDYIINMEHNGDDNYHDMTLYQDEYGNLSGHGGSPAGDNTYLWTINEGMVSDDSIAFTADYTATDDAVNPQTTIVLQGIIADDGTMSGTWSDNYDGSHRAGNWSTDNTAYTYPENDDDTVSVTVDKFVQGTMATAASADFADFPMTSVWDDENGVDSGSYTLGDTNNTPYRAMTSEMEKGSDYQTSETLTTNLVGAECSDGKPFALEGYTSGNTKAAAMNDTPSMVAPSFTNLQQDKFVIVWNRDCDLPYGEVGGDIDGQLSGEVESTVELEVTSIEMVDTTATANGSFNDGWEYVFHITAPMDEENISMKFSDWLEANGVDTINVANNMRISSMQADNNGATILLTDDNVYSTPALTMVEDIDLYEDGRQVEITVEVAVPFGTSNGTYTTSYGVMSN